MIRLNNIVATYTTVRGQVNAVDGVDLTIPDGKIVGVAGESGCGKTTLLKVIYGDLVYPLALRQGNVEYEVDVSGSYVIESKSNGRRITTSNIQDYWFKYISYIPQSSMSSLNPVVRIRKQFVDFLGGDRRTADVLDRIREYVKSLDLPPRHSTPIHTNCRVE